MTAQTTPSTEAAHSFIRASSFVWHQRWELVPGVETPGIHPLQYLFDLAQLPDPTRLSVLDIGTANGGVAFLLERQGARSVVAIDVFPEDQFGFGATREFLGSDVEYIQGTVYDLGRLVDGQKFDLVVFWGVLYHLRHPLLALDEVRSVLAPGGLVSFETAVADDEVGSAASIPVARFYAGDELAGDASNWFSPTVACVNDWFSSSGLEQLSGHVWGEGQMKRLIGSYRATSGPAPFTQISYEVPLRAVPVADSTDRRLRRRRSIGLADRYPPPERPWSNEYAETHRGFVAEVLDDPDLLALFREGGELPSGFGVGLDERVVEFPWLLAQGLGGRLLDAGSSLNHEHIVQRVRPLVSDLHVVTLVPEEYAFTERNVSYVYADLRDLPYRDGFFDVVVCLSTLEHVGMDNSVFGVGGPRAADPAREAAAAVAELRRVSSGRLLFTVPYGRREDHGWLRQFDRDEVEELCDALAGHPTVTVFRYTPTGWRHSDLEAARGAQYRDFTADQSPVEDLAAAARAVVCIAATA